jgi:hypothetical protein
VTPVPQEARRILGEGTLCYLAARTSEGPHVTPVVFVLDGGRLWATTARRTVKARTWRRDPVAAGLVRHGDRAVTFRGTVTLYDALDPLTWPASVLRGPVLARASTRFTLKNARFFAGYARDAAGVPLSWSPPGRVVVSVDLDHGALLDASAEEPLEAWGEWGDAVEGRSSFRAPGRPDGGDLGLPRGLAEALGRSGPGALGIEGSVGPTVLPVQWARAAGGYVAVLPRRTLALAGTKDGAGTGLVLDRPSSWRAARMRGALLRGPAAVHVPGDVRSGREALLRVGRRAGTLPADPAVITIEPRTAVWWRGWSSGTVRRP